MYAVIRRGRIAHVSASLQEAYAARQMGGGSIVLVHSLQRARSTFRRYSYGRRANYQYYPPRRYADGRDETGAYGG